MTGVTPRRGWSVATTTARCRRMSHDDHKARRVVTIRCHVACRRSDTVRAAHGDEAYLVKDINATVDAGTGDTVGSQPAGMMVAGGQVFFSATGVGGRELYRTDGTTAGTVRLSIRPGAGGAFPMEMRALGAKVVFTANDGVTGRELWISDGTPAGTTRVKDIRPGTRGSEPRGLAVLGDRVYLVQ